MVEYIRKDEVMDILHSLPADIAAEHIHELPGIHVDEDLEEAIQVTKRLDEAIELNAKGYEMIPSHYDDLTRSLTKDTYDYTDRILRIIRDFKEEQ